MIKRESGRLGRWAMGCLGWRLEQRTEPRNQTAHRLAAIVVGVVIALIAVQLAIGDEDAFDRIYRGTVGSKRGWSNILDLAAPLLLTGLAAAVALKLRRWNVGVEGQFFMGAFAAVAIAFQIESMSGAPLLALMFAGAALCGAAWITVPAIARAYLNVNEILTTLMLNFVAILFLAYVATGPWRNPQSQGSILATRDIPEQARLPGVEVAAVEFSSGLLLGIAVAVVLWLVFRSTTFGYMVRTVGGSEKAGSYAGINVRLLSVAVLLLSGGVAGVAGVAHMTGGDTNAYATSLSNNTGYLGIAVAVLAGGSFPVVVLMAGIIGAIISAGSALRLLDVGSELGSFGLTGFILLMAAIGEGLANYRLRRERPGQETLPPGDQASPAPAASGTGGSSGT